MQVADAREDGGEQDAKVVPPLNAIRPEIGDTSSALAASVGIAASTSPASEAAW
jgi:hypothetical protein